MKSLLSAVFVIAATTSQGIAGSLAAPIIPPQIIAAPAAQTDWSGFYAGGMFGFENGEWELINSLNTIPPSDVWDTEGSSYGIFAGYNLQFNNLVLGGELAYSMGESTVANGDYDDSIFDVKARAGYAYDDFLIYGVAGWSTVDHDYSGGINVPTIPLEGLNYGAGAQYRFDNGLFVGVEYLARDLTGGHPTIQNITYEYRKPTVSLRVGKQF